MSSKPEREQHWAIFFDAGFAREEFLQMSDDQFSQVLNFISESRFNNAQQENGENVIDLPPVKDEELTIDEQAKKIANLCKNQYPIQNDVKEGIDISNTFIAEFESEPISYHEVMCNNRI